MKRLTQLSLVSFSLFVSAFAGCGSSSQTDPVAATPESMEGAPNQATIEEAFSKLSPEDCLLAESQKYCAVASTNPLGSMGTPLKIDVNGEAVFLCCSGCKSKALSNPEETLANVAKLKSENSTNKPTLQ